MNQERSAISRRGFLTPHFRMASILKSLRRGNFSFSIWAKMACEWGALTLTPRISASSARNLA